MPCMHLQQAVCDRIMLKYLAYASSCTAAMLHLANRPLRVLAPGLKSHTGHIGQMHRMQEVMLKSCAYRLPQEFLDAQFDASARWERCKCMNVT